MTKTAFMLDFETLATTPDAVVASIGVTAFNPFGAPGSVIDYMEIFLDLNQSRRRIDPETVMWWMQQPEEARNALFGPDIPRVNIITAMQQLDEFFRKHGGEETIISEPNPDGGTTDIPVTTMRKDIELWSCGTTFDETILRSLYQMHGVQWPFEYWQSRDFRTVRESVKAAASFHFTKQAGYVKHSALQDALFQSNGVQQFHNMLRTAVGTSPVTTEPVPFEPVPVAADATFETDHNTDAIAGGEPLTDPPDSQA